MLRSLVGSEMCIRVRFTNAEWHAIWALFVTSLRDPERQREVDSLWSPESLWPVMMAANYRTDRRELSTYFSTFYLLFHLSTFPLFHFSTLPSIPHSSRNEGQAAPEQ